MHNNPGVEQFVLCVYVHCNEALRPREMGIYIVSITVQSVSIFNPSQQIHILP